MKKIIFPLLLIILVSIVTAQTNLNIPTAISQNNSLVDYTSFDVNITNSYPDNIGDNDCYQNGTTLNANGYSGGAMYSDRAYYSECNNTNAFTTNRTTVTISMIVQPTTSIINANNRLLYIQHENGSRIHQWTYNNAGNTTTFTMKNASFGTTGQDTTFYTGTEESRNTWVFWDYVINSTGHYLYRNAVLINSSTGINRPLDSTSRATFLLGGIPASNEFNGSIDEFQVYSDDLSPAQVTAKYNSYLKGIKVNDTLYTTSAMNVTSLNKRSIYTCHVLPTISYWNTSRLCLNSSDGVLHCVDTTSSCYNFTTGLVGGKTYTVAWYEVADNGINTTIGASLVNTTSDSVTYYACYNGSDSNSGLTVDSPLKTLKALNAKVLTNGDEGKLCRSDNETASTWRSPRDGYLALDSGTNEGPVYYGDYTIGSGQYPPTILGSNVSKSASDWTNDTGTPNVWRYTPSVWTGHVGSICFEGTDDFCKCTSYGMRNWSVAALVAEGDNGRWFNNVSDSGAQANTLYVYSVGNPYTRWGNIEIWRDTNIFGINGVHDVRVQNISLKCGGRHAIDGSNVNRNVYSLLTIGYIGGGYFSGEVRLGNGIQFTRNSSDNIVENNSIYEIYDAATTVQADSTTADFNASNNTFRYNKIWNSAYCWEYYQADDQSTWKNTTFDHNTCYRIGYGWYSVQRWNYMSGVCFRMGEDSSTIDKDLEITNNICANVNRTNTDAFVERWQNGVLGFNTPQNHTVDYNLVYNYRVGGGYFAISGDLSWTKYTNLTNWNSSTIYDKHTIEDNPRFISTDSTSSYFLIPKTGSPACTASSTGGFVGASDCLDVGPVIENITVVSITNNSIYFTWAWDVIYDADYNKTEVCYNTSTTAFSCVANVTKMNNDYNLTGLADYTTYYIYLRAYDHAGNAGDFLSISQSTNYSSDPDGIIRRFTGYTSLYYSFTSASSTIYNVTFTQIPYIISGNLDMNITNSDQDISITTPLSHSCSANIDNCDNANDNNDATYSNYDCESTDGIIDMTFLSNYSADYMQFRVRHGRSYSPNTYTYVYCYDYTTDAYSLIGTTTDVGVSDYTIDIGHSTGCIAQNENLTIHIVNHCGNPQNIQIYETDIIQYYNKTVAIDNSLVYNNGSNTNATEHINMTTALRSAVASDVLALFNFTSVKSDWVVNFTISYLYTKSINVSIYDYANNSNILNPLCTFNGGTLYPKTQLLTYNSSAGNNMNCSLLGYANINQTITPDIDFYNLSMSGFGLNITLLDEETDLLINSSMFVNIIQGSYAKNYTVTNGSLILSYLSMPVGTFQILYGGTDYATRSYFINVTSETAIELYTVKLNDSTLILFEVTDEVGYPITESYLKVQRYFIDEGAWKLIGMETIDNNGQAGMYLIANTVPYILLVEKEGAIIFRSPTTGNKIFSSPVKIRANTLDDILQSYTIMNDYLTTNLTWDNATKTVSFFWNDASGRTREACLQVIKKQTFGNTVIDYKCASSTSGTITVDLSTIFENNTVYEATGYIDTDTVYTTWTVGKISFGASFTFDKFGKPGLFLSMIFIITMFFLGLYINAPIAIIYTALSMIILEFIGITGFGGMIIVSITIFGLFLAVVTQR